MTVLTLRYQRGDFAVTGPDIEPVTFKTRPEAWWSTIAGYSPAGPITIPRLNEARETGGPGMRRRACCVLGARPPTMIHDLITAFIVAFAAVTASELLARIWEYSERAP
jgi:hypothetical protein